MGCLATILTLTSFKANDSSALGISHYVIHTGIYINDGTAMTACGYESYNSQIKLEEIFITVRLMQFSINLFSGRIRSLLIPTLI